MKKIFGTLVFIVIVFFGIEVGLQGVKAFSHNRQQVLPASTQENQADPGVPVTLQIPKIGLTAKIESVSLDAQQRMDVPKNSDDAGWYSPGYKPGEKGNAVLDGHLDKVTGAPAAFWNVSKLISGDKIIITDEHGKNYTFSVVDTQEYPYNDFPIKQVFGPSSQPMLNLITCHGTWDAANKNYSQRLVIYAKLVE